MRKLVLLLFTVCLFGADFWQSKPFAEWSDKEINKMLTGSPWARSVSISLSAMTPPGGGRGGRGGRGGGGGGGFGGDDAAPARPGGDDLAGPGGGAPGGNIASRGDIGGGGGQAVPSLQLTVRWQSAMPMKQALVRRRFGAEAATSPDAKKFLDDNAVYLIALAGLPAAMARFNSPEIKSAMKEKTTLTAKDKPPLHPVDVGVGPPGQQVEIFFVFPKTTEFTLDDKEIEFATSLGAIAVKQKFRLKDMLVNGTLQL
ncbi:MAG: hypothetical protein LAP38_00080 [Acidobacteriia bacterium]|nr:hypothetical protein [Terriglobia bacterium]